MNSTARIIHFSIAAASIFAYCVSAADDAGPPSTRHARPSHSGIETISGIVASEAIFSDQDRAALSAASGGTMGILGIRASFRPENSEAQFEQSCIAGRPLNPAAVYIFLGKTPLSDEQFKRCFQYHLDNTHFSVEAKRTISWLIKVRPDMFESDTNSGRDLWFRALSARQPSYVYVIIGKQIVNPNYPMPLDRRDSFVMAPLCLNGVASDRWPTPTLDFLKAFLKHSSVVKP